MNRDLKKFLYKLLLLTIILVICIIFVALFGIFVVGEQFQASSSLGDKISRLKSINEPKIILEGGSNLAFGINSPMIQEAVNMPVVNLGLHNGFGNAFNENMMKCNLNSGDIVIVCHLSFSDDNTIANIPLMWRSIEYNKELWEILRLEDYPDILQAWPDYWWDAFLLWIEGGKNYEPPYSRSAFNEYGDIVIKPEESRKTLETLLEGREMKVHDINEICINRLNELNRYVNEHGATLLVAGYPIMSGDFTPPPEDYDAFTHELSERLDCEVISDYRDYFIPYQYFYDTRHHLDEQGAKIRTAQLIKDIKRWQSKHR